MRQVNRLAYRTRRVLRRPPSPRWLVVSRWLAALAILLGGAFAIDEYVVQNEIVRRQAADLVDNVVDVSRDAGLVVRDVYADGQVYTEPEELLEAVRPFIGHSMLDLDIDKVGASIRDLPWVRSVSVRREFPDRLIAQITEHRPLALWHDAERLWLVDTEGEIVPIPDLRDFANLPLLTGEGAPEQAHALFNLLSLEPTIARRVTGATRISGRRWNVYVDGRIEVRLPSEGAEHAWRRLAEHERREQVLDRAIESVDLRLADRLIVRVREPDAASAPQGA
jgi:cell division protein FtsQ